jgi:hypothetical protein
MEAGARGLGVDVNLREAPLQEPPCSGERVRSAALALERHESAVGLLGIAVELDSATEYLLGGVERAELLFQFGEAEVRVEGPAMEVLADRLDPSVVGVLNQLAPI